MRSINKYVINLGWNELTLAQASEIFACKVAGTTQTGEVYFHLWALVDEGRVNETHHIYASTTETPLPTEFQSYRNYEHLTTETTSDTTYHVFQIFCRRRGMKDYQEAER